MKITSYVVTHKKCNYLPGKTYIGVGSKEIEGVKVYDNTRDNISSKNKYYCELTALYWIYKNDKRDIISFEHYRRYFYKGFSVKPLKEKYILSLFNKGYEIVLPKKHIIDVFKRRDVYSIYSDNHIKEDMDLCEEAIKNLCPEYLDAFNYTMHSNHMTYFNMFITKKELLDEYAKWLFMIFDYVEPKVDFDNRTEYQKRVFGFLSERLFNVWLNYKRLKTKVLKVTFEGEPELIWRSKEIKEYLLGRSKKR